MNKISYLLISVLFFLYSCDNRKDFYNLDNEKPLLDIIPSTDNNYTNPKKDKHVLYDTIKYNNIKNNYYRFYLNATNESVVDFKITSFIWYDSLSYNISYLSTNNIFKGISIKYNSENKNIIEELTSVNDYSFKYRNNNNLFLLNVDSNYIDTRIVLTLVALDKYDFHKINGNKLLGSNLFDNDQSKDLSLFILGNLPPVALFTYQQTGTNSPYDVKIDASQSYDKDERYGGGIIRYFFELDNGYTVETSQPTINRIFPGQGTYQVRVRVMDNDSVWSNFNVQTISVN